MANNLQKQKSLTQLFPTKKNFDLQPDFINLGVASGRALRLYCTGIKRWAGIRFNR
jgi:hypothetical protein